MLAFTELDSQTISNIFTQIISHFFKRFSDEVKDIQKVLIDSVITIYETIKTNLLPTPKKSHYTFNLRDIWKVVQGICSANPKSITSLKHLIHLWYHENMRVYHDRLISKEDKDIFIA